MKHQHALKIRPATPNDVEIILQFICELAEFERLAHEVKVSRADLERTLFSENKYAHVVIGEYEQKAVAFALYFFNYSTFLGKPGIYLEDLFVKPTMRSMGFGKQMLSHLAKIAVKNNCGRMEWSVLNWNTKAIQFYEQLGSKAMDEWTIYRLTGEPLQTLSRFND